MSIPADLFKDAERLYKVYAQGFTQAPEWKDLSQSNKVVWCFVANEAHKIGAGR